MTLYTEYTYGVQDNNGRNLFRVPYWEAEFWVALGYVCIAIQNPAFQL
jgi:hypothetical protein